MHLEGETLQLQDIRKNQNQMIVPERDLELCCQSSTFAKVQTKETITIRDACKRYDRIPVLCGLQMTVPQGIIYGLLGASGCGKTTLLNCIVGLKQLDSGKITVLGGIPGCRGGDVLGPRVGYMPQGTALYGDFTISETLIFFGWIAGMTTDRIKERINFLLKLLMLPNPNQRVISLSAGQQRRVSLATALLHEPELLILDEPTVGLDPVLRETIWDHFLDITRKKRTTVVITTHYIDEARNANLVALMRGGYLLVEESPKVLLRQHGLESLEEIFVKLSQLENYNKQFPSCRKIINEPENPHGESSIATGCFGDGEQVIRSDTIFCKKTSPKVKINTKSCSYFPYHASHMKALFWKNFLWMVKNFHITLLAPILPFVTISLLCVCIGNYPADLNIAVVNYETNNTMVCEEKLSCDNSQLSCHYFKYLEKQNVTMVPYESEYAAIESVKKGKTYASIVVKNNYSLAMHSRVQDWQSSTNWEILSTEIDVFRDLSSFIVANYIKELLYESFQSFLGDYMACCDIESKLLRTITMVPVYGKRHSTFTEFIIPGILLTFVCILSAGLTMVTVMIERNEGLLERILVCGVSKIELLTVHVICQFVIMVLLTMTSLISAFLIFDTTLNGSFFLILILSLMTGFCGMCFGLCVSCVSERMAYQVIGASPFLMIILSGIIWPIEGMHCLLKPIALAFPLTHATESMRSIMIRGWDISNEVVYMGFIMISIWTISFLLIIVLIIKFKKD